MGNDIIISALGPMVGTAAVVFGWFQYRKSQKLEKEKSQWEKEKDESKGISTYVEKMQQQKQLEKNRGDYCRYIAQNFEYMELFGGRANPWLPPLEQEKIYTPLRIEEYLPWLDSPGNEQPGSPDQKRAPKINGDFDEIFKFLYEKSREKSEPLKLVLAGPPGSGKTTLLRWLTLQCVISRNNTFSHFIPVFIPAGELAADPNNSYRSHNLKQLVFSKLEALNLAGAFFAEAFAENRVLFLIDGLDEVADKATRQEIFTWLRDQALEKNPLVVTCQKACFRESEQFQYHPGVHLYTLREFDRADVRRYLESFYRVCEYKQVEKNGGIDTDALRIKASSWYGELEDIMSQNQNLGQLVLIPGLLTVIAIICHRRDRIAVPLYELCKGFFKHMMQRFDTALYPGGDTAVEQLLDYLSSAAASGMEKEGKEMEYPDQKNHGMDHSNERPLARLSYKGNHNGNLPDLRTQWQIRYYARQLPGIPG